MFLPTLNHNTFSRKSHTSSLSGFLLKDQEKLRHFSSGRTVSLGHSAHWASLRISRNLISSRPSMPIVSALSGRSFQDLYIKSSVDGIVLTDRTTEGSAIAAVIKSRYNKFTIYSHRPNYCGQERVNRFHNRKSYPKLHTHATVERVGKRSLRLFWQAIVNQHTLSIVQNKASRDYYIKHIIKKHDELVASSRYGPERSYIVAGADPVMMILLSAITDEVSGQQEKNSGGIWFSSYSAYKLC